MAPQPPMSSSSFLTSGVADVSTDVTVATQLTIPDVHDDSDGEHFISSMPVHNPFSVAKSPLGGEQDYETNSDWDNHEGVHYRLAEYEEFKKTVKGYEKWTKVQAKLHKLLALRGFWPMLAWAWTFNFKTRNIYPSVYAPEGSMKRVAIKAVSDEFRAAKALESLFDLPGTIHSYRQTGKLSRVSLTIRKTLERHIRWAIHDAGCAHRSFPPTMEVYEFNPAEWNTRPVFSQQSRKVVPSNDSDLVVDDTDPISDEVEYRLRSLAQRHQAERLRSDGGESWAPLLIAYVVLRQMVMVVSLDSSEPGRDIHVFAEIDMFETDQWLWNALALALPIQMARDELWEWAGCLNPSDQQGDTDDPDI